MGSTSIEWTDRTWNPVRGCTTVSEGCRNCYAMKQAHRFSGPGKAFEGLTKLGHNGPQWTGKIRLVDEHLADPLHWKQPQRVFVNSMSDLFHPDVPFEFIDKVFAVMALCPQHTFQILTKRPERMLKYLANRDAAWAVWVALPLIDSSKNGCPEPPWPLPNVWLGVSVEDQKTADERIPLLLQTPAAVRFVSYEPALGPVDFDDVAGMSALEHGLDWVIVGGESGPGARPFNIQWARDVVAQCKAAEVACFLKQLGKEPYDSAVPEYDQEFYIRRLQRGAKGQDWSEWPEYLRVREYPATRRASQQVSG